MKRELGSIGTFGLLAVCWNIWLVKSRAITGRAVVTGGQRRRKRASEIKGIKDMSAQPKPQDEMIAIDETAELLNVSTTLLQRWALADFGPPIYIVDNGFRYRRDEVVEWRDKNWRRDRYTQAG
jgi:hypothetical protein